MRRGTNDRADSIAMKFVGSSALADKGLEQGLCIKPCGVMKIAHWHLLVDGNGCQYNNLILQVHSKGSQSG